MAEKHQIIEAHTLENGEVEMHMSMGTNTNKVREMVANGEKEVIVSDTKNLRENVVLGETEVTLTTDARTARENDDMDEI